MRNDDYDHADDADICGSCGEEVRECRHVQRRDDNRKRKEGKR